MVSRVFSQTETLLLSIRPAYADKIFAGTKTVELRRRKPRVSPGTKVLIYVSATRMELAGGFEMGDLIKAPPRTLWRKIGNKAGVNRDIFDGYFKGTSLGFAIVVKKAWMLPSPLSLACLREKLPAFHPPQCYRYLDADMLKHMGLSE